jgi:hypothetical protein
MRTLPLMAVSLALFLTGCAAEVQDEGQDDVAVSDDALTVALFTPVLCLYDGFYQDAKKLCFTRFDLTGAWIDLANYPRSWCTVSGCVQGTWAGAARQIYTRDVWAFVAGADGVIYLTLEPFEGASEPSPGRSRYLFIQP